MMSAIERRVSTKKLTADIKELKSGHADILNLIKENTEITKQQGKKIDVQGDKIDAMAEMFELYISAKRFAKFINWVKENVLATGVFIGACIAAFGLVTSTTVLITNHIKEWFSK